MSDDDLLLPSAKNCAHPQCQPTFDEEAAKRLLAECKHPRSKNPIDAVFGICTECINEIRKRWPRFWGKCPTCGAQVIAYASAAHYTYGDW